MKEIISGLPGQVREAIAIGEAVNFNKPGKNLGSVIVCGLGGSGIGGKIISLLVGRELKVPFLLTNDYAVPACVNESTLLIASSYSGNTEETIYAVREGMKRGAEIAVITSGGELLRMAKANNWNHIVVPGGQQPRAMLAYSLVQQLVLLTRYGLIPGRFLEELQSVPAFLESKSGAIRQEAKKVADFFHGRTPVIYAGADFEGIAVRFRQQLNENAKVLCWHHVLPEMTHNELVGWAGGSSQFAVVFLSTDFDHERTTHRWTICRQVISNYTSFIHEIKASGPDQLTQNFYLIHLTDWISWYLAENKKVDPVEVDVIGFLKSEMAKKG
jgi:glucose/mannose-6-phosphate isomerase